MKRFFEYRTDETSGFINIDLVTAFRFHKGDDKGPENLKVWFTGDGDYLKIDGKAGRKAFEELKIVLGREGLL